jgi:hypothetical protein
MQAQLERMIIERMTPEPVRAEDRLVWEFATKGELHTFVTKLNDLILNELMLRDVKYVDDKVVFSAKGNPAKQVSMLTKNQTLALFIDE